MKYDALTYELFAAAAAGEPRSSALKRLDVDRAEYVRSGIWTAAWRAGAAHRAKTTRPSRIAATSPDIEIEKIIREPRTTLNFDRIG